MDGAQFVRDWRPVRIVAAGSVDDGKSTLIGRLLLDSDALLDDERQAIEAAARRRGLDGVDLAALTDGLSAERAQGITIDVAWRHFATPARRFLLADVPGHEQYTRNMATGASGADIALVLVDAAAGMTRQTRRHLSIAILLGIRAVVVAVNKMDAVGYARDPFDKLRDTVEAFCRTIDPAVAVMFVPISALCGDNVVRNGDTMRWHDGPTLLGALESIPIDDGTSFRPFRFPVQLVRRQPSGRGGPDHRWHMGRIESGRVAVGDRVVVAPAGATTRIAAIRGLHGAVSSAAAPDSVTIRLADQVDVTRGDMIAGVDPAPLVADRFDATLFWLGARPLDPRRSYVLRHGARMLRAMVPALHHALDVETGARITADGLSLNGIAAAEVRLEAPLAFDRYRDVRESGSLVLIDPQDESTVAAGVIDGLKPAM